MWAGSWGRSLAAFRSECVPVRNEGTSPEGRRLEGRSVRQAPAAAVAEGEAVLFQFEQGIAETGIVDAQPLTQGGS